MAESMSRRRFLQSAGLSAAGAVLASCAPKAQPTAVPPAQPTTAPAAQPTSAPAAQPTSAPAAQATAAPAPTALPTSKPAPPKVLEVRVQDWGGDWQQVAEPMFQAWMANNTDVKIVYEPYQDNWQERTLAAMVAGTAPEVIHAWGDVFRPFSDRGQLLNLDDLYRQTYSEAEQKDFHAYQIAALIRDGFRFAMPKHVWLGIMYYNKDMFDEAGQAYPDESWGIEEYSAAMEKLCKDEGKTRVRWGGYVPAWAYDRLVPRIQSWGGEAVDQVTHTISKLGEQPAIDAIEWVRSRMWDSNIIAQQLQVENKSGYDSLVANTVAMAEEGSSNLLRTAKAFKGNFDIALLPKGPVRRVALGGTNGYGMYKGAVDRGTVDAAWRVIQLLVDPEFQKGMVKAVSRTIVPARVSAVAPFLRALKEGNPELANVNVDVITRGLSIPDYPEATDPQTFKKHAAAAEIITPALERIFIVGDAPSNLFVELKDEIEATQK